VVLGFALLSLANAQAAEGRRGGGMMMRGSFLGLLGSEQVQQELKLSEEQKTKVQEVTQKLREEMKEQYAGLRDSQDREQARAKMTELSEQLDSKARTQLQDVLSREQMRRLYQIRTQVRGAVASLNNSRTAERLQLTEEQKKKVAELDKTVQDKLSAAFSGLRDASADQRGARMAELGKIRRDADEQALGLLTAEQKEAFQKMQGEKFELQLNR